MATVSVRYISVSPAAAPAALTSGRARALVAAVVGLIGMNLGGLALARSRRSRSAD